MNIGGAGRAQPMGRPSMTAKQKVERSKNYKANTASIAKYLTDSYMDEAGSKGVTLKARDAVKIEKALTSSVKRISNTSKNLAEKVRAGVIKPQDFLSLVDSESKEHLKAVAEGILFGKTGSKPKAEEKAPSSAGDANANVPQEMPAGQIFTQQGLSSIVQHYLEETSQSGNTERANKVEAFLVKNAPRVEKQGPIFNKDGGTEELLGSRFDKNNVFKLSQLSPEAQRVALTDIVYGSNILFD